MIEARRARVTARPKGGKPARLGSVRKFIQLNAARGRNTAAPVNLRKAPVDCILVVVFLLNIYMFFLQDFDKNEEK